MVTAVLVRCLALAPTIRSTSLLLPPFSLRKGFTTAKVFRILVLICVQFFSVGAFLNFRCRVRPTSSVSTEWTLRKSFTPLSFPLRSSTSPPCHSWSYVLVCPRRQVKRFVDLTANEISDLWLVAQKIGNRLESYYQATSLTFTIQDGPEAGQTVGHVHIHILPRKGGDFANNDEIYDAIDGKEKEMKEKLDLDQERKDRSMDEMAQEAALYRSLFL